MPAQRICLANLDILTVFAPYLVFGGGVGGGVGDGGVSGIKSFEGRDKVTYIVLQE